VGTTIYNTDVVGRKPLTGSARRCTSGTPAAALLDGNVLPEAVHAGRLDADDISASRRPHPEVQLDEARDRADITERFATDLAHHRRRTVACTRVASRTAHRHPGNNRRARRQSSMLWPTGSPTSTRATAIERAVIELIASTTSGTSSTFSPRRSGRRLD